MGFRGFVFKVHCSVGCLWELMLVADVTGNELENTNKLHWRFMITGKS